MKRLMIREKNKLLKKKKETRQEQVDKVKERMRSQKGQSKGKGDHRKMEDESEKGDKMLRKGKGGKKPEKPSKKKKVSFK